MAVRRSYQGAVTAFVPRAAPFVPIVGTKEPIAPAPAHHAPVTVATLISTACLEVDARNHAGLQAALDGAGARGSVPARVDEPRRPGRPRRLEHRVAAPVPSFAAP